MEKECPMCKTMMPADATACPACSYSMEAAVAPPADVQAPAPQAAPAAPVFASAPVTGDKKDKTIAGILAILLGGLGIHGFYIGNMKMGVAMLILGVVGGVVTCGVGYGVAGTIGLVQGILYLVATEDDFQRKYVQGLQWF